MSARSLPIVALALVSLLTNYRVCDLLVPCSIDEPYLLSQTRASSCHTPHCCPHSPPAFRTLFAGRTSDIPFHPLLLYSVFRGSWLLDCAIPFVAMASTRRFPWTDVRKVHQAVGGMGRMEREATSLFEGHA
ncbi:unnamed protein product [Mycena citricolor]|uniref:Secreted protein n=1 Tax=Mycena citricolor TaxID=2018698 RepID=A0AAD2K4N4_9AGAR|nr:unnamed protein product [Mycena citricolor]